jgi:hypothetical protein
MKKNYKGFLAALVLVGVGGVSAVAFQSHAQVLQQAPVTQQKLQVPQSAVVASATSDTVTESQTSGDTDNVQNNQGGADKPGTAESGNEKKDTGNTVDSQTSGDTDNVQNNQGGTDKTDTAESSNEKKDASTVEAGGAK